MLRDTDAGTAQGSIISSLLSNVALAVLDEHIAQAPGGPGVSRNDRLTRRRHGQANYRLIRYADDWRLVVSGNKSAPRRMFYTRAWPVPIVWRERSRFRPRMGRSRAFNRP